MADTASELRQAILGAIKRQTFEINARLGNELGPQVTGPVNAHAASTEPRFDATFATAYDGSVTVVPFTWDTSTWDGPDEWTGS